MKKILFILFLVVSTGIFSQVEVESEVKQESVPCLSCATGKYSFSVVSDNPSFHFVVFKNNILQPGDFKTCKGDIISLNFSQDCDAFNGCGQWSITLTRAGVFMLGSSSDAASFSQIFVVP